jgi:predicted ATP-grasp superfamily ATP-dependent carboligase
MAESNKKINVLVFPCGSEIGLEIFDSLQFNKEFNLIGVSSVEDHGSFVYPNYLSIKHSIFEKECLEEIEQIISEMNIDLIYPTMDSVVTILKENESFLGKKVIAPPIETVRICLSKNQTYQKLQNVVKTPHCFLSADEIEEFPVFIKPNVGYGSRGALIIKSAEALTSYSNENNQLDFIIQEYLPGAEYTVDCFTDNNGKLLFSGARERLRISNGISVSSKTSQKLTEEFYSIAERINHSLHLNGAWFFQLKRNKSNEPVLLEVACRFAGTSSVHRIQGVNFALLNCYLALNRPFKIMNQNFEVNVDRSLSRKFKINFHFDAVYVDLDDTFLLEDQINGHLVHFLCNCRNRKKKLILLTKHYVDPLITLRKMGFEHFFDEIIHLKASDQKSQFIKNKGSIFIDDSFKEREDVLLNAGIPVFSAEEVIHLTF